MDGLCALITGVACPQLRDFLLLSFRQQDVFNRFLARSSSTGCFRACYEVSWLGDWRCLCGHDVLPSWHSRCDIPSKAESEYRSKRTGPKWTSGQCVRGVSTRIVPRVYEREWGIGG